MSKQIITIIIPTYKRANVLKTNLELLKNQILENNIQSEVCFYISDNESNDGTNKVIEDFKNSNIGVFDVNFNSFNKSVGFERNIIHVLHMATTEYVMYLGDDDFLPAGYIKFVTEKIASDNDITCIIPGFSELYSDGKVKPARTASFSEKEYEPSFAAMLECSRYGHQLSGLVFKRDNLYESYENVPNLHNIYPFIYFVCYCCKTGKTIYAPKYQVLVSQSNAKYWKYDQSGLLTEIIKNYKIILPDSYLKRNFLVIIFMYRDNWRLRVSKNLFNALRAFLHLLFHKDTECMTKAALPFIYVFAYTTKIIEKISSRIRLKRHI